MTKPLIRAEARSYDHAGEVTFDAAPWFEAATDDEIRDLAACGWGGDHPAEAVAEALWPGHPELSALFDYLRAIEDLPAKQDCCGFECRVDPDAALRWVHAHRPHLALKPDCLPAPPDPLADRADRLKAKLVDFEISTVEEAEVVNQDIGSMRTVAELIRFGGLTHAGRVTAEKIVRGAEDWYRATTGEKVNGL